MASDIFDVQPPAWLRDITRPSEPGMMGKIMGELVGGMAISAQQAKGDVDSGAADTWAGAWLSRIPKGIQESRLNVADPMWRLKAQQAELGMAHTALAMQEQMQTIDLNKTKLRLNAEDTASIPKWLQDHPTVESRMDAEWPAAQTPEWNRNLDQLRLRDSQSSLAKVTVSGLKELSDAVNDISLYDGVKAGELSAKIQPYAVKGQMPPPELTAQVMEARSSAETKKFERTKELYGIKGTGQPVAQKYIGLADQEEALAEDFRAKGDVAGYQEHKSRADNYRSLAAPKTTEISTSPTGETKVTFGKSAGSATTAMATEAQRKIVRYEDALTLINQLQRTLQPGDVGPRGVAGETILDVALPAFGIDKFFSGARIENRTALGTLRESLMRQVSEDPRFSNLDRETISNLLPRTGVFESYPAAMSRMDKVKAILTDRIGAYSGAVGKAGPASTKTPAQIIAEYNAAVDGLSSSVKASKLTPEQAYQQAQQLHKKMTDDISRFH